MNEPTELEPYNPTEIIAALHTANAAAKRQPHVLGTVDYPSRWDRAHRYIDTLLDQVVGR